MRLDAILLAALAGTLALSAAAQAVVPDAQKRPADTKEAKAPPTTAPKASPPKAPPKKVEAKKADPKKGDSKAAKGEKVAPNVTVYRDAKDMPVARDKQGNVIPTDPNAYDVSSAMSPPKAPAKK